jgi:hypothetical protein
VTRSTFVAATVLAVSFMAAPSGSAQEPGLKLAVGDFGLGIGDVPRLDGLRLNFRDRHLERVRGINATIWSPHEDADGTVRGIALGFPLTGAGRLSGLALGAGIAVSEEFRGVGLAPLGMGAGGRMTGIMVAGLGIGGGGDLEGIMLGGLGAGLGGSVTGIAVGGLGIGAGGDVTGLLVGGLGGGAGGNVTGIAVGGLGVGAGGDMRGLLVGGLGSGVGGDLEGIAIGGVGVGAGGEIRGVAVGGVGVGASRLRGVALSGVAAGGGEVRGVVIAPAYFRIDEGGLLRGVSVSAFNHVRGRQHGLSIGLLNIADELHGVQIGILNISRNDGSLRVVPILNYIR